MLALLLPATKAGELYRNVRRLWLRHFGPWSMHDVHQAVVESLLRTLGSADRIGSSEYGLFVCELAFLVRRSCSSSTHSTILYGDACNMYAYNSRKETQRYTSSDSINCTAEANCVHQ